MAKKKWEEYKKAAQETIEQLLLLPVARSAAWLFYEKFLRNLASLESTIHRLSEYVRVRSELNHKQYLDLKMAECANYVAEKMIPATPALTQTDSVQSQPATTYIPTDATPASKNTKLSPVVG